MLRDRLDLCRLSQVEMDGKAMTFGTQNLRLVCLESSYWSALAMQVLFCIFLDSQHKSIQLRHPFDNVVLLCSKDFCVNRLLGATFYKKLIFCAFMFEFDKIRLSLFVFLSVATKTKVLISDIYEKKINSATMVRRFTIMYSVPESYHSHCSFFFNDIDILVEAQSLRQRIVHS